MRFHKAKRLKELENLFSWQWINNSSFGCNNLYQELENWRIYSPDSELIIQVSDVIIYIKN